MVKLRLFIGGHIIGIQFNVRFNTYVMMGHFIQYRMKNHSNYVLELTRASPIIVHINCAIK